MKITFRRRYAPKNKTAVEKNEDLDDDRGFSSRPFKCIYVAIMQILHTVSGPMTKVEINSMCVTKSCVGVKSYI